MKFCKIIKFVIKVVKPQNLTSKILIVRFGEIRSVDLGVEDYEIKIWIPIARPIHPRENLSQEDTQQQLLVTSTHQFTLLKSTKILMFLFFLCFKLMIQVLHCITKFIYYFFVFLPKVLFKQILPYLVIMKFARSLIGLTHLGLKFNRTFEISFPNETRKIGASHIHSPHFNNRKSNTIHFSLFHTTLTTEYECVFQWKNTSTRAPSMEHS